MAKSSIDGGVVGVRVQVQVPLRGHLRDARELGRADVLAVDVELADPPVHALGQPLLEVRDDGGIFPPRAHVVARAITGGGWE